MSLPKFSYSAAQCVRSRTQLSRVFNLRTPLLTGTLPEGMGMCLDQTTAKDSIISNCSIIFSHNLFTCQGTSPWFPTGIHRHQFPHNLPIVFITSQPAVAHKQIIVFVTIAHLFDFHVPRFPSSLARLLNLRFHAANFNLQGNENEPKLLRYLGMTLPGKNKSKRIMIQCFSPNDCCTFSKNHAERIPLLSWPIRIFSNGPMSSHSTCKISKKS